MQAQSLSHNTGKMLSGLFKNATINNRYRAAANLIYGDAATLMLELIFQLNLPNAITEPVKATAPIKIPKKTSTL